MNFMSENLEKKESNNTNKLTDDITVHYNNSTCRQIDLTTLGWLIKGLVSVGL